MYSPQLLKIYGPTEIFGGRVKFAGLLEAYLHKSVFLMYICITYTLYIRGIGSSAKQIERECNRVLNRYDIFRSNALLERDSNFKI